MFIKKCHKIHLTFSKKSTTVNTLCKFILEQQCDPDATHKAEGRPHSPVEGGAGQRYHTQTGALTIFLASMLMLINADAEQC